MASLFRNSNLSNLHSSQDMATKMKFYFIKLTHVLLHYLNKSSHFLWKLIYKLKIRNEGYWLSKLSLQEFADYNKWVYKNKSKYSDIAFNTGGLKEWERQIAETQLNKNSNVIIIGAGGGREAFVLQHYCKTISAYETDKKMIDFARSYIQSNDFAINYSHLAYNTIPETKCDVIWLGWGVYTHIAGRNTRVSLLQDCAKNIDHHHGRIVISYWPENRSKTYLNLLSKYCNKPNTRSIERGESFQSGLWGILFTKEDIYSEASEAGLLVKYISQSPYGHAVLSKAEIKQQKGSSLF